MSILEKMFIYICIGLLFILMIINGENVREVQYQLSKSVANQSVIITVLENIIQKMK